MSQTTYDFQSKENNGHAPLNNIINAKLIAYVIGILLWVEGGMLPSFVWVSPLLYREDSYKYFFVRRGYQLDYRRRTDGLRQRCQNLDDTPRRLLYRNPHLVDVHHSGHASIPDER